jgi:glucose/arabinose dehydrogenase
MFEMAARVARMALFSLLAVIGYALVAASSRQASQAAPLGLPPGFSADLYATGLHTPRFVAFSPDGDLYVAEFGLTDNVVKVLPDRNHDGKPDRVVNFASGFLSPNNIAFHQGAVYVGELGQIDRLIDTNGDLVADQRSVLIGNLPADGRHRTKTIGFGPDGKLYLNVGSFNDDAADVPGRATIWQYNADGTGGRIFASGLRNTVGFDWDPTTGEMWGTDNGSDDLGINLPPDELNLLSDGQDYGWPFCIGDQLDNPKLGGRNCGSTVPPVVTFPPHSAPLGMAFYTGSSFPSSYWGGIFVAQHSIQYPANRGIVFVPFKDGKPSGAPQPFYSTGDTWVDVAVDPYDGSLFATQDANGAIYRISYTGAAPTPAPPAGPAPTAVPGKPAPQTAAQLPGLSKCDFPTGKCLRGAFLTYWASHGGVEQFGYPVTNELIEQLSDGKTYTVQYTERARFELHPENQGKESYVLLGRLGADLAAPRANEQPFRPVPPCGSCNLLYFPQTGHAIGQELQDYWQTHGGIPVFGYPLSEAFNEQSPTDGKIYLVQYFERNRLEYHPENIGTQFEVLLGLLGVQTYRDRYGANP